YPPQAGRACPPSRGAAEFPDKGSGRARSKFCRPILHPGRGTNKNRGQSGSIGPACTPDRESPPRDKDCGHRAHSRNERCPCSKEPPHRRRSRVVLEVVNPAGAERKGARPRLATESVSEYRAARTAPVDP